MSDILVSIIESLADAAARRGRRQEARARTAVPWQPPDVGPPTVVSAPTLVVTAKAKPAARAPAAEASPEGRIELRRLFADPQSLIRTVVAAEILGPPLALRRQNLWDTPGV